MLVNLDKNKMYVIFILVWTRRILNLLKTLMRPSVKDTSGEMWEGRGEGWVVGTLITVDETAPVSA